MAARPGDSPPTYSHARPAEASKPESKLGGQLPAVPEHVISVRSGNRGLVDALSSAQDQARGTAEAGSFKRTRRWRRARIWRTSGARGAPGESTRFAEVAVLN